MNTYCGEVEIQWLAAVLAPWAVSPHPNFSETRPHPAALLALVAEGRDVGWREKYALEELPAFAINLIDSAADSTRSKSQQQGAEALLALSQDTAVPYAARTAAALFASVAFAELEQHGRAISMLQTLSSVASIEGSSSDDDGGFRLCIGAIELQLALRYGETYDFVNAHSSLTRVASILPPSKLGLFRGFPVSKGISWSPQRVQTDMLALLRSNAESMRATFESVWGTRWEGIVRGRSGWIVMRQRLREAERDRMVLQQLYEERFEATSNRVTFKSTNEQSLAWNALLLVELSAGWSQIRSAREAYARTLMFTGTTKEFEASEALRLLRHSGSKDLLNAALRQLRMRGPLIALRNDAGLVLTRDAAQAYASASDLRVLQSAADVLGADELGLAIERAMTHLDTTSPQGESSWARRDRVLKTLISLVVAGADNTHASEAALHLAKGLEQEDDASVDAMRKLIKSISWSDVSQRSTDDWRAWARAQGTDHFSNRLLRLTEGTEEASENDPLSAAMALLGVTSTSSTALNDAVVSITDALEAQRREAAAGSMSFGGYDPFDICIALAGETNVDALWDQVALHIVDNNLEESQIARGLDRLALEKDIPARVAESLFAQSSRLLAAPRTKGFFGTPALATSPSALRAMSAVGAISEHEAMALTTQMMSEGVLGKLEGTKSVSRVGASHLTDWRLFLLLQSSYDPDPEVVAEAGLGLGAHYHAGLSTAPILRERVLHLLRTDGITVPMRVMQGLYRNHHLSANIDSILTNAVRQLGQESLSHSVRSGCSDLLTFWHQSP